MIHACIISSCAWLVIVYKKIYLKIENMQLFGENMKTVYKYSE